MLGFLKAQELEKMTFYIEEPGRDETNYPVGMNRTIYQLERKENSYTAVHTTVEFVEDDSVLEGYSYIEQVLESEVNERQYRQLKKAWQKYGVKNWGGFAAKEKETEKEPHFAMEMTFQDRRKLLAEGYGNWPKGYQEYVNFLRKFFGRLERMA